MDFWIQCSVIFSKMMMMAMENIFQSLRDESSRWLWWSMEDKEVSCFPFIFLSIRSFTINSFFMFRKRIPSASSISLTVEFFLHFSFFFLPPHKVRVSFNLFGAINYVPQPNISSSLMWFCFCCINFLCNSFFISFSQRSKCHQISLEEKRNF